MKGMRTIYVSRLLPAAYSVSPVSGRMNSSVKRTTKPAHPPTLNRCERGKVRHFAHAPPRRAAADATITSSFTDSIDWPCTACSGAKAPTVQAANRGTADWQRPQSPLAGGLPSKHQRGKTNIRNISVLKQQTNDLIRHRTTTETPTEAAHEPDATNIRFRLWLRDSPYEAIRAMLTEESVRYAIGRTKLRDDGDRLIAHFHFHAVPTARSGTSTSYSR